MRNTYYLLRHGESLKNVKNFESCWPEKIRCPLTQKGKKDLKKASRALKEKKIDLIFYSDLLRTKQTAEIVGKKLGLEPKADRRLREVGLGVFNGKPLGEFGDFWNQGKKLTPLEHYAKRFSLPLPGGETYKEIESRLNDFIGEMEKKHKGKRILIVSHQRPLTLLEKAVKKYSFRKFVEIITQKKEIKTGEVKELKLK